MVHSNCLLLRYLNYLPGSNFVAFIVIISVKWIEMVAGRSGCSGQDKVEDLLRHLFRKLSYPFWGGFRTCKVKDLELYLREKFSLASTCNSFPFTSKFCQF